MVALRANMAIGTRGRAARHGERHRSGRTGWLRAAVLGSDDAIVSTASLMLGMAAASASQQTTLVAGVAGLVAGSMSMAAGEYVSVSSQRDAEQADITLEQRELQQDAGGELRELAGIYVKRGLDRDLAMKVAEQLSAHDRLGAHLRDELGIARTNMARPLQAAGASADFAVSGLLPILALLVAPAAWRIPRRWRFAGQPGRARCAGWTAWGRCPGSCGHSGSPRRRPGDGSHRGRWTASRRLAGLAGATSVRARCRRGR